MMTMSGGAPGPAARPEARAATMMTAGAGGTITAVSATMAMMTTTMIAGTGAGVAIGGMMTTMIDRMGGSPAPCPRRILPYDGPATGGASVPPPLFIAEPADAE